MRSHCALVLILLIIVGCAATPEAAPRTPEVGPLASGRIVDEEGLPVANALVRLHASFGPRFGFATQRPVGSARSGPDGRFSLAPEPFQGAAALCATVLDREHGARGFAGVASSTVAGPVEFGDIEVARASFSELRIAVRAEGRPVAGATVRLAFAYLDTSLSDLGGAVIETDSSGEATIDLAARDVEVHVAREGFATEHRFVPRVCERDVAFSVDLLPAMRVSGRVLGIDGKPFARAGIEAREKDAPAGHTSWAKTDDEGRYVLADLAFDRKYLVTAKPLDESGLPGEPLLAALGREVWTARSDVDFSFCVAGGLGVALAEGDGEPGRIFATFLERKETSGWTPHETGERLELGGSRARYARLVPGEYRVLVFGEASQPTYTEPARVASGEAVLVVARAARGRSIGGRIVDASGEPVRDATVGFEIGPWKLDGVPDGGRLSLRDMPFEKFRLRVAKRGFEPILIEVPPGREDKDLGDLILR